MLLFLHPREVEAVIYGVKSSLSKKEGNDIVVKYQKEVKKTQEICSFCSSGEKTVNSATLILTSSTRLMLPRMALLSPLWKPLVILSRPFTSSRLTKLVSHTILKMGQDMGIS